MGGKEGVAADCASGDCMCWKEQSHPKTLFHRVIKKNKKNRSINIVLDEAMN